MNNYKGGAIMQEDSYRSAYYDLCDYLCGWTLEQYSINRETYEELTEEEQERYSLMSSEVRDRVVSVVGICVPLGLYFLCLFALAVLLGIVSRFVKGRSKL